MTRRLGFTSIEFLLALALTLAAAPLGAHGQACPNTTAASTLSACYSSRSSCRFLARQASCVVGAPSSCEEFYTDAEGCSTVQGCAVNPQNNQCFEIPESCNSLTETRCKRRSDCTFDPTSGCLTGAAAGTCGSHAAGAACKAAGCYWDDFLPTGPRCSFNLQEINGLFSCATWSNYPNLAFACSLHGCAFTRTICYPVDTVSTDTSYSSDGVVSRLERGLSMQNTRIVTGTNTFSTQVMILLSEFFRPLAPVYHSIVLGAPSLPFAIKSGNCTSVLSQPPLGTPIPPSSFIDQIALRDRFLARIRNNRDLSYANGDALDAAVNAVISRWSVNGTSIIRRADVDTWWVYLTLSVDLNWCASTCGCSKTVFPTYTQYNVPIGLLARSTGDNLVSTSRTVVVSVYTYGSVQISANSQNPFRMRIASSTSSENCPAGQAQRLWSIWASFDGVYDTDRIVGLRNLSDVSMTRGFTRQVVGNPTNCFGTEPYEVLPPTSCADGTCTTEIRFRARCVALTPDGQALNDCRYQPLAIRAAEMGSNTTQYWGGLNSVHTFFQSPKSWLASLGISDPSPVTITRDNVGPDTITVYLTNLVFPAGIINYTLPVRFGFSPLPDGPFASILDLTTPSGVAVSSRNAQLYFVKTLTPVVFFGTPQHREGFRLFIDISTIRVFGLSSTGMQLGSNFLSWDALGPVVQRSPRQALAGCPSCMLPNVTFGLIGIDAFSVPVAILRALLPANGYRFEMFWVALLPEGTAPGSTPFVARRRLLSDAPAVDSGSVSMTVMLTEGEPITNSTWDNGWDKGSSSKAAGLSAFALVGVTGLVVAPVAIKAAMLAFAAL